MPTSFPIAAKKADRVSDMNAKLTAFYEDASKDHVAWDIMRLGRTTLVSVKPTAADCFETVHEFFVHPRLTNKLGSLYGGIFAIVIDDLTSMSAMFALNDRGDEDAVAHVSTHITTDFLASAPENATMLVTSRTRKLGKTLVFTECIAVDKLSSKVYYTGTHHKFILRKAKL